MHAYIISALRKDMPSVFGKDSKKKELIKNLDALYGQLQREHQISPGDFPDIKKMQEVLQHQDFAKFRALDKRLLDRVSGSKFTYVITAYGFWDPQVDHR